MQVEERRLSKRKTLARLGYIELPGGNGGIVTDVSEGGLGFRAVTPVEHSGPMRFWFSGGPSRISAAGDLVWTDDLKKCGGVRFIDVPDEILNQIRNWPFRTNLRLEVNLAKDFDREIGLGNHALANGARANGAGAASKQPAPPTESRFPENTPRRRPFLKALGMSGLAGVIGLVSYLCYREAREWLNSNPSGSAGQASRALALMPSPTHASEIALLKNGASLPQVTEAPAQNPSPEPGAFERTGERQEPDEALAPDGSFRFVQVAAYARESDALKLVERLRGQGFVGFVTPPTNDALYRVQLGPYQTAEAARLAENQLEKAGFTVYIRR